MCKNIQRRYYILNEMQRYDWSSSVTKKKTLRWNLKFTKDFCRNVFALNFSLQLTNKDSSNRWKYWIMIVIATIIKKPTISRPPVLYHIRASDLVTDLAVRKAVIITQMTNDHDSDGIGNEDDHEHCDLPSCPLLLRLLNCTNAPSEQQLRRWWWFWWWGRRCWCWWWFWWWWRRCSCWWWFQIRW